MEVKELTQEYAKKILKANGKEAKVKFVSINAEFSLEGPEGVEFGSKGDVLLQKGETVVLLSRDKFKELYM